MDSEFDTIQSICDSSKNAEAALARVKAYLGAHPNSDKRVPGQAYRVDTLGAMARVPDEAREAMLAEVAQMLPKAFGLLFKRSLDQMQWRDDGVFAQTHEVTGVGAELTPRFRARR